MTAAFYRFVRITAVKCVSGIRHWTLSWRVAARRIGKIVGGMAQNRSRAKIEKRRHVRNTRVAEWKGHRPKRPYVSKNGTAIRMSGVDSLLFKMSIVWHSALFLFFFFLFVQPLSAGDLSPIAFWRFLLFHFYRTISCLPNFVDIAF